MDVVVVEGEEQQPGVVVSTEQQHQLGPTTHQQQQQAQHFAIYGSKHDTAGSRLGLRSGSGSGVGGYDGSERRMVDITRDKPIKVAIRVQVPVRDHPKFNFVGKLLGPKGNSLKRLQEDTMCKMAVLGRGSMKDRQKEEQLRVSGDPKFSHLMEDLHVEISAYATPAEAHARIAYALAEVRRFLVPDYNDDIRQEQMWEMQILNTQQGKQEGGSVQEVEAPLSPASSVEAANSPTPAITANACINGLQDDAIRPSSSPPHSATAGTLNGPVSILPAVTSSLSGRKRPLLPNARPAMSPTKRTVMSLLARARAAQNKEPVPAAFQQQQQQPPNPTPVSLCQQVQQQQATVVAAASSPLIALQTPGSVQASQVGTPGAVTPLQQLVHQRQPLIQTPHAQHHVLAPAIHGLLHAQRTAAGAATILPIMHEDFIPGVGQHQIQNVHIT